MKLTFVGILCLSLSACFVPGVSVPVSTPQGPAHTASEIMDATAVTPREGAGVILVARGKILTGMKCTYDVAVDGKAVAGLRAAEHIAIYANPGPRLLSVSVRAAEDCKAAVAEVPVNVVAYATTRIRVTADLSYDLKLEATTH
jgi:hypothetical protein